MLRKYQLAREQAYQSLFDITDEIRDQVDANTSEHQLRVYSDSLDRAITHLNKTITYGERFKPELISL